MVSTPLRSKRFAESLGGLPTKDWFSGGLCLVQAADSGRVRSIEDRLRVFLYFGSDRLHGFHKLIHFLLGFALSRLDHQGTGHDERKSGGVWVKAVVDEALGDVHGTDAFFRLHLVAEDNFVHARRVVG